MYHPFSLVFRHLDSMVGLTNNLDQPQSHRQPEGMGDSYRVLGMNHPLSRQHPQSHQQLEGMGDTYQVLVMKPYPQSHRQAEGIRDSYQVLGMAQMWE